jgi:Flp pilus assembly pilin Flp
MWQTLSKIRSGLQRLIREEDGQDLVEYALIILVCVIATLASVGSFASVMITFWHYIITNIGF